MDTAFGTEFHILIVLIIGRSDDDGFDVRVFGDHFLRIGITWNSGIV